MGRSEVRRLLGRFRGRLEYNIEVTLKDVGWDSMDEFNLRIWTGCANSNKI